jgi:hypothetical protein
MEAVVAHRREALTEGVEYFDPGHHLIDIVRRATANRQDIIVSAEGVGHLILLSTRGEYFPSVSDLALFCKVPADRFKVEVLKQGDGRLPAAGYIGSNIDELMWCAAFHVSEGRLMEGCYRDDVVQLSVWPNLTRLPRTPNSIRLSALFTRYPTSITFAGRMLGIDRAEMFQFYSAARCAGFARALNRKPEEPALQPHRNKSLLSLLLGKIADL